MMQADRILVFARGSSADDPAVSRAFTIAKHSGSRLMLLDVFHGLPESYEPLISSLPIADAREEAQRERRGELSHVAEALHQRNVHANFDVRWGVPSMELVHEAVVGRHDLIVIEDDRAAGVHAATRAIVRQCPALVWVVKNMPHVPPARVVAAVDPVGSTAGALDRKVLVVAAQAAEAMRAELYVVHAWQPLHDEFEWLPDGFRRLSEKTDVLKAIQARHAGAVADLVADVLPRLPGDCYRLVEGRASSAVLETVDEMGADLLVMGTARTGRYAGLLLGRTAEEILEQSPVSILAVKPDGFVSPLPS